MLVQEDNPGIEFEYSMPSGHVKPPGDDRYAWEVGQWSECSGIFLRVVVGDAIKNVKRGIFTIS